MKDNVDVIYRVPKDLAFRCLKKCISRSTVKLAVYKPCVDTYIMRKTVWNIMPLLKEDGVLAMHCNFHNISHVIELADCEQYSYDVLFFCGSDVRGEMFSCRNSSIIPFVLLYKGAPNIKHKSSLVNLTTESALDEIMWRLLCFVDHRDVAIFVGEAAMMALMAKNACRDIIAFWDDDLTVSALTSEGVLEQEVSLS